MVESIFAEGLFNKASIYQVYNEVYTSKLANVSHFWRVNLKFGCLHNMVLIVSQTDLIVEAYKYIKNSSIKEKFFLLALNQLRKTIETFYCQDTCSYCIEKNTQQ